MKASTAVFFSSVVLLLSAISFGQGCSKPLSVANQSSSTSGGVLNTKPRCQPQPGVSGSPKTIEEAVTLINSLPKPVSVACFIESLERPLKVSLTSNSTSAQPAVGWRSPRIFIFSDKLLISVVPEGTGRNVVEFSVLTGGDSSIKGELPFPVSQALQPQTPYDHILYGSGTVCGVCHGTERRATEIPFANAFASRAFQPNPTTLVDLELFRKEATGCDSKKDPERCEIIRALFNYGEVRSQDFPANLPTFF